MKKTPVFLSFVWIFFPTLAFADNYDGLVRGFFLLILMPYVLGILLAAIISKTKKLKHSALILFGYPVLLYLGIQTAMLSNHSSTTWINYDTYLELLPYFVFGSSYIIIIIVVYFAIKNRLQAY